jgi:signal transduction histidine kinase
MPEGVDPTERLLGRTRRRLLLVTFALVATLVVGVGGVTAVAGLAALDDDVDRSLAGAVAAAVAHSPGESSGEGSEVDDVEPASADTFVLYLDETGAVVSNPSRIKLAGLPVGAALTPLTAGATEDWRTVTAGGLSVRLLTVPVAVSEGSTRFVQGGFVLTLHDLQSRSLVAIIAATAAAGLLAAAIVTALLTRRALAPIRQSIEAQRRFVADASHELRTPAAIIRASAEVLQREGHVDAAGAPLAADIVEESARLGRLVAELLTLASADARGLALQRERLDLAALAGDTVRATSALAAEHDVRLTVAAPAAVLIDGDRDRLTQLLVVLLDNAIGHSPSGAAVEVNVEARGSSAVLAVRDHGPGVPEADRARIFEPFMRSAAARQRGAGGSGLGLAIARSIAVAHGGQIDVEDAAGGGARFVMTLARAH